MRAYIRLFEFQYKPFESGRECNLFLRLAGDAQCGAKLARHSNLFPCAALDARCLIGSPKEMGKRNKAVIRKIWGKYPLGGCMDKLVSCTR
jgi:hypothetical protein